MRRAQKENKGSPIENTGAPLATKGEPNNGMKGIHLEAGGDPIEE